MNTRLLVPRAALFLLHPVRSCTSSASISSSHTSTARGAPTTLVPPFDVPPRSATPVVRSPLFGGLCGTGFCRVQEHVRVRNALHVRVGAR